MGVLRCTNGLLAGAAAARMVITSRRWNRSQVRNGCYHEPQHHLMSEPGSANAMNVADCSSKARCRLTTIVFT